LVGDKGKNNKGHDKQIGLPGDQCEFRREILIQQGQKAERNRFGNIEKLQEKIARYKKREKRESSKQHLGDLEVDIA
jgi:hypothetical protein